MEWPLVIPTAIRASESVFTELRATGVGTQLWKRNRLLCRRLRCGSEVECHGSAQRRAKAFARYVPLGSPSVSLPGPALMAISQQLATLKSLRFPGCSISALADPLSAGSSGQNDLEFLR
jgi:hypothetical protein